MPNNMPYDKWFWSDWFASTSILSIETKGVWHEILGRMYLADRTYFVEGTALELSRMVGCSEKQIIDAISELQRRNIADVTFRDDGVTKMFTVECRRYKKAFLERKRVSESMARIRNERKRYTSDTSASDYNHNPEPESDIDIKEKNTKKRRTDVEQKPLFPFPSVFPFEDFWNTYDKKVERAKCEFLYAKIGEDDRAIIKATLPDYVASTPEVKYRKNPQTYLNGKCWNDEILKNTTEDRNGKGCSYGRYTVKHGS